MLYPMSTYDTEFGLDEEVAIRPKKAGKRGIVREIILSSHGKHAAQEYGVEVIGTGSYTFSHFKKSELQALS